MNLNGGYVMIDLDNSKDLLERTKQAYESRKPLIVRYNGRLEFATFEERTSFTSNYSIALSNNTLLSIVFDNRCLPLVPWRCIFLPIKYVSWSIVGNLPL